MYFHRLEDLRVDHDKTQIEIAEYLNLNREVYRRYEKGTSDLKDLSFTAETTGFSFNCASKYNARYFCTSILSCFICLSVS